MDQLQLVATLMDDVSGSGNTLFNDSSEFNMTTVYPQHPDGEPPYWNIQTRVFFAFLIGVLMVTTIVGNLLVILVIARNRGMRTRTNIFLCNLAIADLGCAVFDMPITLTTMATGEWIFNDVVCQLNGFVTPFFLVASIHSLMYISIHKYLSIRNPFVHGFRRRWIYMMLSASWIWAGVSGYLTVHGLSFVSYKPYSAQCGPEYPHDIKTYIHFGIHFSTCIFIPLCIMTFSYVGVFIEMKAHSERMQKNTTLEKDRILDQQKRITVTIFLVLLVFVICWLPFNAYTIYLTVAGDYQHPSIYADPFSYLFCYTNSAANPIIYALRSAAFREGYKQIICRKSPSYWPEDNHNSMTRRFSQLRCYLRDNLQQQLLDNGSGTNSVPTSRKNSMTNMAHVYLFSRKRNVSTTSLPQHLTFGTTSSIGRQRKYRMNTLKARTLNAFARLLRLNRDDCGKDMHSNSDESNLQYLKKCETPLLARRKENGEALFDIPEVIISKAEIEDDHDVTVVQSPEPMEMDNINWENELDLEQRPMEHASNVSVTPGYSAAVTSDVDIMVGGQTHLEHIPSYEELCSACLAKEGDSFDSVKVETFGQPISLIPDTENKRKSFEPRLMANESPHPPYVERSQSHDLSCPDFQQNITKCSSAPLLDDDSEGHDTLPRNAERLKGKHTLGHFLKSVAHHKQSKRHPAVATIQVDEGPLIRSKSEKIKKFQRFPSVEQLDSTPILRKRSSRMRASKGKHSQRTVNSSYETRNNDSIYDNKSWFLRENKNGHHRTFWNKTRGSKKARNQAKSFHERKDIVKCKVKRSLSDPCVTFKMIEEKVLVRKETRLQRSTRKRPSAKSQLRSEDDCKITNNYYNEAYFLKNHSNEPPVLRSLVGFNETASEVQHAEVQEKMKFQLGDDNDVQMSEVFLNQTNNAERVLTAQSLIHSASDPGSDMEKTEVPLRTKSDSDYDSEEARRRWTFRGFFSSGSGADRETAL